MNLWVLVIIVAGLAIPAHLWFRSFVIATLSSALLAAVLYQVAVSLRLGYLDKFIAVAFIVTFFVGAVISVVVGAGLRLWSRRHPSGRQ